MQQHHLLLTGADRRPNTKGVLQPDLWTASFWSIRKMTDFTQSSLLAPNIKVKACSGCVSRVVTYIFRIFWLRKRRSRVVSDKPAGRYATWGISPQMIQFREHSESVGIPGQCRVIGESSAQICTKLAQGALRSCRVPTSGFTPGACRPGIVVEKISITSFGEFTEHRYPILGERANGKRRSELRMSVDRRWDLQLGYVRVAGTAQKFERSSRKEANRFFLRAIHAM
ncbi:hypothetical protein FB451DRAFT_1443070 [Mycena latifolia]|nr:hypothetical protein FB451DRAFT_1443070 [Mycena latifolia]